MTEKDLKVQVVPEKEKKKKKIPVTKENMLASTYKCPSNKVNDDRRETSNGLYAQRLTLANLLFFCPLFYTYGLVVSLK